MKAGLPFTFPWKWLAQLAGFAGLYFALARFGNIAAVAAGNVAAMWPAAGLAVAGLWWGGYRLAPAIFPRIGSSTHSSSDQPTGRASLRLG